MTPKAAAVPVHYQLKIELRDIDPIVWRRVLVPSEFTLFDLHHVIQIVMGWENCHLHEFSIKRKRYTLPEEGDYGDAADESETRLRDVVAPRSKILYQYDFGDCWNHVILVEKAIEGAELLEPTCVEGARACPPEDSGGSWGYADKLRALSDPNDEEHEEGRGWLGANFDPESFDLDAVNKQLQKTFRPKPRKKKR